MLPEEDLPPSWLRDYGQIEADVARMEEFAVKLRGEVEGNYAPHLDSVYADMLVELPTPPAQFGELSAFITAHVEISQSTADNTYYYRDATGGFATAAATVSERYRNSDAFSAARVSDVENALNGTAAAAPPAQTAPGDSPASGTVQVGEGPPPLPRGVM
jgi:hypothetical protein